MTKNSIYRWGKRLCQTSLALLILSGTAQAESTEVSVWRHSGGAAEVAENQAAIERFNKSQDKWKVVAEVLPQGTYTEAITAAAVAKNLPCVLELDQPTVPNFAWAQHIQPLEPYISKELLAQLSPGAVGRYKGILYSVGQFDAALAMYGRRSVLEKHGIRIPTMEKPWSKEEFEQVLKTLKESGEYKYAIDFKPNYTGEWWPYAYSPLLQSWGGAMIDRSNFQTADEVLNGEKSVAFAQWFQKLFAEGYAERNPADDKAFEQGRVVLDYNGNWVVEKYAKAWGDDLVIMPSPDLGNGPVIGAASWQWGITSTCAHPEGAAEFINFLMQPKEIAAMSKATGLIPVTAAGAEESEKYKTGGPWRVFYNFSNAYARVRPPTPAYPVISSSFEKALRDIKDGADVLDALDKAVDTIDQNIEDNEGYGLR